MPTQTALPIQVSGMLGGTYLAGSPIVVRFFDMTWPVGSSLHMLNVDIDLQWHDAERFLRYNFNQTLAALVGPNPDSRWEGYLKELGYPDEITPADLPAARAYNYSFLVADKPAYSLDVRTAYQSYYFDYDFRREVIMANAVITFGSAEPVVFGRAPVQGTFTAAMSYIDQSGIKQQTTVIEDRLSYVFLGRFTEMERLIRAEQGTADIAADIDPDTGDVVATTKPNKPELIGADSLFVVSCFVADTDSEDAPPALETHMVSKDVSQTTHLGRTFVRDASRHYTDFLIVNSRGAIESCSGVALDSMEITASSKHYHHIQGASFSPERPLFSIADGGQRSWNMSSGYVSRAWAEWWTLEFLSAPQWWMRIGDRYYPVTIEPSKKNLGIYDRTKQSMPHIDFTVTLAYEG